MTRSSLAWGVRKGELQNLGHGVYLRGSDPPTAAERAAAAVIASDGIAYGTFAAALYELDSIVLHSPFGAVLAPRKSERSDVCTVSLSQASITEVRGYRCTTGLQTMIDLARMVDDLVWEQALESALRKELLSIANLEERIMPSRSVAMQRIRRVLALRPPGTPPTGSVLETYAVQLLRTDPVFPVPDRQVEVWSSGGTLAGRVDLAFPAHGIFLELDGGQHKEQPQYDSSRQNRVISGQLRPSGRCRRPHGLEATSSSAPSERRTLARLLDDWGRSRAFAVLKIPVHGSELLVKSGL